VHNLVTGGIGFIGHHLVNLLVDAGETCAVLDNARSGNWSNLNSKAFRVDRSLEDMTDAELEACLNGVDTLYHLAAEKYNSSSMTPNRVIEVNVASTDRLFAAAVKVGVKRIVFTSSLYAYGSVGPKIMDETDVPAPWTHYGISKLSGEHLLMANCAGTDTSWNTARLFFIYGPRQFAEGGYKSVIQSNFERLSQGKNVTIKGDGNQRLDYVFIDDCIRALHTLGTSDVSGKVVNVASGKSFSVQDVLRAMCRVAGREFAPDFLPKDWTHDTDRRGGRGLIGELFGWSPEVELEMGLREIWGWLNEQR
jgi:UDP-glucose 4-epimerase